MRRLDVLQEVTPELELSKIALGDWKTCFAGHVCRNGIFEEQGLFLNDEEVPAFSAGDENHEGFEALAVFFGLTMRETLWLFSESAYSWEHLDDLPDNSLWELFNMRLDEVIEYRREHHGYAPAV